MEAKRTHIHNQKDRWNCLDTLRKEGFKNPTLTGHIDDKRDRATASHQPDVHVEQGDKRLDKRTNIAKGYWGGDAFLKSISRGFHTRFFFFYYTDLFLQTGCQPRLKSPVWLAILQVSAFERREVLPSPKWIKIVWAEIIFNSNHRFQLPCC